MFNPNKDKFRVEGLITGLLIGALIAAVSSLLLHLSQVKSYVQISEKVHLKL